MPAPDRAEPPADGGSEKKTGRGVSRVVLAALFFVILAGAMAGWFALYAFSPGPSAGKPEATVFIPPGSSVEEIGELLDDAGLLRADFRFLLLTRLLAVSAKLPAGEFRLDTRQTPVELLRQLVSAKPVGHRVTIAEGLRIEEIAALFADDGWADKNRFIALTRDASFIESLGLERLDSLEGYLYPDTYLMTKPAPNEETLIERLVRRSLSVWSELDRKDSRLSRHEVFTLASIIEKETGRAEERPLIASVFHNRLERNMRLQSDPTVIYGIEDFDGAITRKDLARPDPYNTYHIQGLPPGPICSPGRDALQAVLTPADSDYLYFVSKNDGSHQFSTNLRDHNRAVRTYQR